MESSEIIHWNDDAVISMQTRAADRTGDFDNKKPPVTPATNPPPKKKKPATPCLSDMLELCSLKPATMSQWRPRDKQMRWIQMRIQCDSSNLDNYMN